MEQETAAGKVIEEWFTTKDGVPIYTKTWKATSDPVATVVFLHGYGEHIDRYDYVFNKFSKNNIEVYGYDQRGFGRTAIKNKNPGITGGWQLATNDITDALRTHRKRGIPQFLVGHSMGSSLVLDYACDGPEKDNLSGFLTFSPLIEPGEHSQVNNVLKYSALAISKVLPNLIIPVSLNANDMTHDSELVKKISEDPLMIRSGALKSLADIVNGTKLIFNQKYKDITSPIYFSHGTADMVTSPQASRELFEKIPSKDKTFREWKGLYHELHNEYEKDQIIDEYIHWIIDHVNNKSK